VARRSSWGALVRRHSGHERSKWAFVDRELIDQADLLYCSGMLNEGKDHMHVTSAVPPGRIDLACDDKIIEMYSIQHADVAKALEQDGVVHPKLAGSPFGNIEQFVTAYCWLANRLRALADTPAGFDPEAGAMFWGWARITRRELCRAVSEEARRHEPSVLLRVRLARSRVVLTDFSDWHDVLNSRNVYGRADKEAFEEMWAAGGVYANELERDLEATYGEGWGVIPLTMADTERVRATWPLCIVERPRPGAYVQGVCAHLEAADVVSVVPL
jgi:hypothetical protein